jgi:hypothetical protein
MGRYLQPVPTTKGKKNDDFGSISVDFHGIFCKSDVPVGDEVPKAMKFVVG